MIMTVGTIDIINMYANIALAFAAYLALYQIVVTRSTAVNNSKRESIRLASDLIGQYLGSFVSLTHKSYEYEKNNKLLTIWPKQRLINFTFEEAEAKVSSKILKHAYAQYEEINSNHPILSAYNLDEMNMLEMIANPFVAGVADCDSAFKSIGKSFCFSVESLWFHYISVRLNANRDLNFFSSTIELYDMWKSKIEKNELEFDKFEIDKKLSSIVTRDIKSLGT